jgi:hypothetical protein
MLPKRSSTQGTSPERSLMTGLGGEAVVGSADRRRTAHRRYGRSAPVLSDSDQSEADDGTLRAALQREEPVAAGERTHDMRHQADVQLARAAAMRGRADPGLGLACLATLNDGFPAAGTRSADPSRLSMARQADARLLQRSANHGGLPGHLRGILAANPRLQTAAAGRSAPTSTASQSLSSNAFDTAACST